MAYSQNILPKSAAYYTLSNASIVGTELNISAGGFAEIQISEQMLVKLTKKMLVVAHPSVFSSAYTNDAVQVTLSIITSSGTRINNLIPVSYNKTGVFNTEIELPEEEYISFTYRISSKVPVVIYNWELCAEEASDMSEVIEGIEQELPKLLYDYNTYAYAVGQSALTVGLIYCFLHSDTDLQGHFTISFFATEKCNVHVRIKDNDVTELFSPQVFTVEAGYASISIPHAYLKKKSTDHAFSVTMQCTNGQLSIPVRGMLYTIDGGYLASRLLDAGVDLQDISIRQLPSDDKPSEIWAIGFEGNQLLLKKREYSQLQRVNWSAVKDFGEGSAACVEFNGSWNNRDGSNAYTLETQEVPFVFIIDLNGTLRVYQGEDFDEVTVLDTNVVSANVCRGFSSMLYTEQDQGLVVAYVKNGKVYYWQWLYAAESNSYAWQGPLNLYDAGDASFVSVHRLPDYRLGFCITHANGTAWYITDRTYVGQSVKTDKASVRTSPFTAVSVLGADMVEDTPGFTAIQNELEVSEYYSEFIMTFSGPVILLNNKTIRDLSASLKVYVDNVAVQATASINGNSLIVTLNEPARAGLTVTIDCNNPYLFIKAYNGCYAYTKQRYSWDLPVAPIKQLEESFVETSASLNAVVKGMITTNVFNEDSASVPISASLNAIIREIQVTNNASEEEASATVGGTVAVTVRQVGETPV